MTYIVRQGFGWVCAKFPSIKRGYLMFKKFIFVSFLVLANSSLFAMESPLHDAAIDALSKSVQTAFENKDPKELIRILSENYTNLDFNYVLDKESGLTIFHLLILTGNTDAISYLTRSIEGYLLERDLGAAMYTQLKGISLEDLLAILSDLARSPNDLPLYLIDNNITELYWLLDYSIQFEFFAPAMSSISFFILAAMVQLEREEDENEKELRELFHMSGVENQNSSHLHVSDFQSQEEVAADGDEAGEEGFNLDAEVAAEKQNAILALIGNQAGEEGSDILQYHMFVIETYKTFFQ